MMSNGWNFTAMTGAQAFTTCTNGDVNSYCGFVAYADVGWIEYTLSGTGTCMVDFGNDFSSGNVDLLLNGVIEASASPGELANSVCFTYSDSDTVTLEEHSAIVILNSLNCEPDINDFTDEETMVANGWDFTEMTGAASVITCMYGDSNSYCGYVAGGTVGALEYTLLGQGTCVISFGNDHGSGTVEFLLNGVIESSAQGLDLVKTHTFEYSYGDVIRLQEDSAVIILNNIECQGEPLTL
jgi:hypothetical protein